MDEANHAQVHIIARQLFDVWKAEQAREVPRGKWLVGSAPAWIALFLSIGAFLWAGGVQSKSVESNTQRIDKIEGMNIESRLTRIEAKVDILVEGKAG